MCNVFKDWLGGERLSFNVVIAVGLIQCIRFQGEHTNGSMFTIYSRSNIMVVIMVVMPSMRFPLVI